MKWFDNLSEEDKDQMTTERGNLSYSAQSCMRYLNKDLWYTEQHTALRDSMLEFQLFATFWKKWKSIIKREFVGNIKQPSWQHLKKRYSATKKREMRLNRPKKANKNKQGELFNETA